MIAAVLGAMLVSAAPAGATTLQQIGSFSSPVFVTSDPNDATRLFVVERGGAIRLIAGGTTATFLDIGSLVLSGGEQGLLSMAFAPDYASSGRFYVFYTSRPDGAIQIDEFTAGGDTGHPASRRGVLTVPHPNFANHNGGQLQFGPDGYLYVSTGDGGGTPQNAQDLNSLLGKILRIDPRPSATAAYSVPADNPFVGTAGADEIWSYGLRNPFRFSFDRSTGAIAIGDVGAGAREEVDWEPQPNAGRGDNFGWYCREGFAPGNASCSGGAGFTEPIFDYPHTGGNCSITGGYVARDPALGDLVGRYVYADHCVGQIRSLIPGLPLASGDRAAGLAVSSPSSCGEDACGHLYVASLSGPVYRFAGDAPPACETGGDTTPPELGLEAAKRQRLDGRIRLEATTVEAARVSARLKIVASGKGSRRGEAESRRATVVKGRRKSLDLGPGASGRIGWSLDHGERRRARSAGGKLTARFTARATDAAGNRGRRTKASSKLSR